MRNFIKSKNAFTMLELILVIVVLGILAAVAIPRLDRDLRQEAADSILADIRYTQHLAMIDDVTNPFNPKWQRAFWRIGFESCAGGSGMYEYVGSDKNYGGGIDDIEAATDPANGKKMIWSGANCSNGGNANTSDRIFVTKKYGITSVDNGCSNNNQYIGFDHLGRLMNGFAGSTTPDYASYRSTPCQLTFTMTDGNFSITIEPETGYAFISDQPNS
jgi:prepilin-type N-terminal cleavage/methylation domain-containing protein